jgi:hypothetical protein
MSKMGLHDPFGHLKHKLWPKERSRVAIWFLTTKSQKFTRFTYVQVACNIPLESSWWELQLCFRPHLNPRSTREVINPQNRGNTTLAISGLSFRSPRTKCHLDVGLVQKHKVYYKGEGGGFPQVRAVVSLVNPSCSWLVLTPKVHQLCTNHLMLVLCRPMWTSEAFQFLLVPSRSSGTPLYPSKVLWARERAPTPYSSVIFYLGFTFESLKELGTYQLYKLGR